MTPLTERDFWISLRRGMIAVLNAYQRKPSPTPLDTAWISALTLWIESVERRWIEKQDLTVERERR